MKSLTFLSVSGFLVVVLVMLVSPKPCWASSGSITTSLAMSIAESNMELEFMMGSEFGRVLQGSSSGYSYDASRLRGPTFNCGRNERYCLPDKNPASGERCGVYNRNC